ncbi:unnamed protein product [Lampetra planeri]
MAAYGRLFAAMFKMVEACHVVAGGRAPAAVSSSSEDVTSPEAPTAEEGHQLMWLFHPVLGCSATLSQSSLNPERNECLIEVRPRSCVHQGHGGRCQAQAKQKLR